jgi:hypothetical protein
MSRSAAWRRFAGLDRTMVRQPAAARALAPADILVDGMRGRSSLWYRFGINLQQFRRVTHRRTSHSRSTLTRGPAHRGHNIRTPPSTPMPALGLPQLAWTSVEDGYRLRCVHVRTELVVPVTGIETQEATMSVQGPGS